MSAQNIDHGSSGRSEHAKGADIVWPVLALLAMAMLSVTMLDNLFGQVLGIVLTVVAVGMCAWRLSTILKQRRQRGGSN